MNKEKIIDETASYVKKLLSGEGSGHDWWRILRVWNNAKYIKDSCNLGRTLAAASAANGGHNGCHFCEGGHPAACIMS